MTKLFLDSLVLNADYTPFDIWGWQHAMSKLYSEGKEAVVTVEVYEGEYARDGRGNLYEVPCIVALKQYIGDRHKIATVNRRNVINRDSHTCQYCGEPFHPKDLTLDHVIPRAHWNPRRFTYRLNSFENMVASCYSCNSRKANRTPQQAGMLLINKPKAVSRHEAYLNKLRMTTIQPQWNKYLYVKTK